MGYLLFYIYCMYDKALRISAKAHDNQYRHDGTPYIVHPVRVAKTVREMAVSRGWSVKWLNYAVSVAYMHDVCEDTTITLYDLAEEFPREIVDAVDAMTRRDNETYFEYLDRCIQNPIAIIVKEADIRDNLRTAKDTMVTRYKKSLEIIRSLS